MRELKIEEARFLLSKFIRFQGNNIFELIKENFYNLSVFRLQKNRIFFCSIPLFVRANNFFKKKIGSIGTCIGRFTRSKKFHFLIPILNLFIKIKKFSFLITNELGEKNFIFGKHLKKESIFQISKNIFINDGIVLIDVNNLPIGIGELLKSTILISNAKKKDILVANQGDIGRYIRTI